VKRSVDVYQNFTICPKIKQEHQKFVWFQKGSGNSSKFSTICAQKFLKANLKFFFTFYFEKFLKLELVNGIFEIIQFCANTLFQIATIPCFISIEMS